MSEYQSFTSNYGCCSQYRKISIGVLVDSISKAETKDIRDAVIQIADNGTSSKRNCVKDHEGHTPLLEKHMPIEQKDTSPWFSTRSFNPKRSSSVTAYKTECNTSFLASGRMSPRLKLLEKTSAANSLKHFAGKTGLESGEYIHKSFGKATPTMDAGKVNNAEHVENLVFSTELGVVPENEQGQDKDRKMETAGNETLRMKLWEILGNVSSPSKHCPSPHTVELHPDKDGDGKHSPTEKRNLNSDTIESDSETHTSRRPRARSFTRKKASSKNQQNEIESKRSTCYRKEYSRKRIFSFRGDRSGRLYDNFNDGSLPSKRNKIEKESLEMETHQGQKYKNAETNQQSENKSRSIKALEKSLAHTNKHSSANNSYDRKNDAFVEPKSGTNKSNGPESPHTIMTEPHKDAEKLVDVEIPNLKYQQVIITDSLLKNEGNAAHDPSPHTFDIKSPHCSPKSRQEKLHGNSPAQKIFNTKGIRSFKSLLSSKSADSKPNVQVELSDDRCELNNSLHMKPSLIMEDNSENQMSKSSTNSMATEDSDDDSHMKGSRESEQLFPESFIAEKFLYGTDKSLGNKREVEVTECSPLSESLKEIQDSSELQIYLEQNHDNGLDSAIALFAVALHRVKTKLKSMSNKKCAEILRTTAEEILLLFQNAESQIKTDVGKLTDLSQSKWKQFENRFQEQQEQLLGICKRFREEVDRHLQDYSSIIEDLEEHEIEFQRTMERQRAAHKKVLSQMEQEINVQLGDAESRIMGVQEVARKKMLQLKLVVAESVKHDTLG